MKKPSIRKLSGTAWALLAILPLLSQAQQADSAKISPAVVYAADSMQAALSRMALRQKVWMGTDVRSQYNELSFAGNLDKGALIPIQGSSKTQTYSLHTAGKTAWNTFQIAGYFNYDKQLEDSTRWRHQTRINGSAPFYFGSIKANHYERSVYSTGAILQKNWWNNKVPSIVAVDYRVGEHFSNNDPRGSLNDFQLNTLFALGYNQAAWQYRLSLRAGYGRERVNVAFKNEKYTKNTADPVYVNWLVDGYGYSQIQLDRINYNDDMRRVGLGAHIAYRPSPLHYLIVNLTANREKQAFKYYVTSETGFQPLGDYTLKQLEAEALFGGTWMQDRPYQLSFLFRRYDGEDYNVDLRANNYLYSRNYAELALRSTMASCQWLLSGSFDSESHQDGNMGNDVGTTNLQVSLGAAKRFFLPALKSINVQLRAGQRIPLNDHFLVSAINANDFTKYVIDHDYLYYTASISRLGSSVEYNFPSSKNSTIGIGLTADYNWLTSGIEPMEGALSVPGNSLFSGMLQLKLYF